MLKVSPVQAFNDNYIWLIHGLSSPQQVVIVDPGDAKPVISALERSELEPVAILVTHHHGDHVGGCAALCEKYGLAVYGPKSDGLPWLDHSLAEGDLVTLDGLGLGFSVLDLPGHTSGHIAFMGHESLFCGDTLFSAGCGRMFEGTPPQMYGSLEKLRALPGPTKVYCGHEYTEANLAFACSVEPDNAHITDYTKLVKKLRQNDLPSLPSTIALEQAVNPFFRCHIGAVHSSAENHHGQALNNPTEVFAALRNWKDNFS